MQVLQSNVSMRLCELDPCTAVLPQKDAHHRGASAEFLLISRITSSAYSDTDRTGTFKSNCEAYVEVQARPFKSLLVAR